jgi:cobalt-zinc-cadmium efflux system outer membrane protein
VVFGLIKWEAAEKEARMTQEAFVLQKEELANCLLSFYDMVAFNLHKQVDLLQLYDEQIQESGQSLNRLLTAYGNTGKDFVEVLRIQQQLLKYRKLKASALWAYHIAMAELDYITAKSK